MVVYWSSNKSNNTVRKDRGVARNEPLPRPQVDKLESRRIS